MNNDEGRPIILILQTDKTANNYPQLRGLMVFTGFILLEAKQFPGLFQDFSRTVCVLFQDLLIH